MSFTSMWMNPNARVNREHNLFVSESKHLYVDAKGAVCHQKKPLDRRTCGSRKIVTRLLVLDVDSGAMYGELHDDETAGQLADFLLRAWHPKTWHFFRGVPEMLNVPAKVLDDRTRMEELQVITNPAGIGWIGPLPGGFAAGVHALRNYENQVMKSLWLHKGLGLGVLQQLSALNSYGAAGSAHSNPESWDQARPLPIEAKQAVQAHYGADYWCSGPFSELFPPPLAEATDLGAFKTAELWTLGKNK